MRLDTRGILLERIDVLDLLFLCDRVDQVAEEDEDRKADADAEEDRLQGCTLICLLYKSSRAARSSLKPPVAASLSSA